MNGRITDRNSRITGAEGLVGLLLALAAVVLGNSARIPAGGIHQFLGMRVNLLNVLFAALFAVLWNLFIHALDLRRWRQLGAFRTLGKACRGCAFMSILLVFYLWITQTQGPLFRIATIFFLLSF